MPIMSIGSYTMPVLYLFIPLEIIIIFFGLSNYIKMTGFMKKMTMFFLIIFGEIVFSALIGTISKLGEFVFPSDILQYIARFSIFLFIAIFFYNRKIEANTFIKYFLIFLNIGMFVGVLQWIPWPGRELFVKLYPFRDGLVQLSQLSRTSLSGIWLHGMAQMATANSGLAMFFCIFGITVYKYYNQYKVLSVILIFTSIINIAGGQGRAAMLGLFFSAFLFYFLDIYIYRNGTKSTFIFILISSIIIFIIYILYINENSIILSIIGRWERLFEESGGDRVDQFEYFKTLIVSFSDKLFGISKPVVNQSAIPYGIEIEPLNVLVLYGYIGFALQYIMIIVFLRYLFKNLRKYRHDKEMITLLVASFIGLASYQVFSIGYRFFRDTNIGLFPWILLGVTIGIVEKKRIKGEQTNEQNKR